MKKTAILILIIIFSTAMQAQKVSNTEEFLDALGSNKTIELEKGEYDLSDHEFDNEYSYLQSCYDGNELVIEGVNNLTIKGKGVTTHLLTEPLYGHVIVFRNCENLRIEGVLAGHGEEKGQCTGGVFYFENCKNVEVDKCVLYGSGMEGLTLDNTENFTCSKTIIKECTYSIMTMIDSKNIVIEKCKFTDNQEFDLISFYNTSEVVFEKCLINNNTNSIDENYISDYAMFEFDEKSSNITLKHCKITNNTLCCFASKKDFLIIENSMIKKNTITNKKYKIE